MQMMFNIAFTDARVGVVNSIIIVIFLACLYDGYKKGFLESGIKFLGTIAAFIGAYLIKNPLSIFMYKHLPFFKIGGLFKGVSVVNILIYELIAFLIVFIIFMVIIKIICDITNIVDKLLSIILFIGLPNKILGILLGALQGIVVLFFLSCMFKVTMNFKGIHVNPSLADDILQAPLLKDTFGDTFLALDEIGGLAKNYESINAREDYNYESLKILIKYDIITTENAEYLVNNEKIKIPTGKDFDNIKEDLENDKAKKEE